MGRLSLVGLFLLAVLVVAYAFVRSGGESPPLSAEDGSESQPAEVVSGEREAAPEPQPAPEPAAVVSAAPTEDEIAKAEKALVQAAGSDTRQAALAKRDQARRIFSQALLTATGPEEEKLRKRVVELNDEVLFSDQALEGQSFLYTFQPGDRLWTLCYRTFPKGHGARVEPGFLLWVNGISDARNIQAGQIIKVPTEQLSLRVVKSRTRLQVLLGGVWIREYAVGIGIKDSTPEGVFEIETKKEKPDWYHQGKRIPFGHPENPLGTRWMGFKRTRKAAGYGIHGTDDPETIGKAFSQGCIRMLNRDVEELFDWVPRGTRVTILR